METLFNKAQTLPENINKVIVGKEDSVRLSCAAFLAGGHLLIEDIPGVGKTMLGLALAKSVSGRFQRVQFTADLLPTDITGVNVFRPDTGDFSFRRGPVFCNNLLADEINRATPRTQSSLLEAMEEGRVTVEGKTYPLDPPFFVIATQNPIELEGTYPLPFSQLDRFMARIELGYMNARQEAEMIKGQKLSHPIGGLSPCMSEEDVLEIQDAVRKVRIEEDLYKYTVSIIRATRESRFFEHGASPRASIHLLRMAQGLSVLRGRLYVLPDDIKHIAPIALSHRVIPSRRRIKKADISEAVRELTDKTEVPV